MLPSASPLSVIVPVTVIVSPTSREVEVQVNPPDVLAITTPERTLGFVTLAPEAVEYALNAKSSPARETYNLLP